MRISGRGREKPVQGFTKVISERKKEKKMKELLIGNAAVARGLYEAGVKVVSSYAGTPSTEITEFAAK